MLTAEVSHKHIYHLRHNCFLGKDRLHFLILQTFVILHCSFAEDCVCLCVCVPKPENRAGSVVSAGVNTAQMITVDVCVWEHCTPHWSISLGVSNCEWFSKNCCSHWELADMNKHIKAQELLWLGSTYCKNFPISRVG